MASAPLAGVMNGGETGGAPGAAAGGAGRGGGADRAGWHGTGFVARGTLVVILLVALASAVWMARDVFFIAFFATLVASFLSLFIDPLQDRFGLRRAIAGPLVLIVLFALLGVILVLIWPTLSAQLATIGRELPQAIGSAEEWLSGQFRALFGNFSATGAEVEQRVRSRAAQELANLVGGTIPLLNTVLGAATGLVLVTFAGLFLAIDPRMYAHGLLRLVPGSKRLRILGVFEHIAATLRRWMAAQAISMLIITVAATIGFTLIGLDAPLALGLIAGLLAFVPYVGPVLGFIPAIAVSVAAGNLLAVVVLYLGIQLIESNIVSPLLMKGVVALPPALTLLFQAAMATLFGFLGLLLAVPILAAAKVVVQELYVDEVAEAN